MYKIFAKVLGPKENSFRGILASYDPGMNNQRSMYSTQHKFAHMRRNEGTFTFSATVWL